MSSEPVASNALLPPVRLLELDALRGIAALYVVLYHYTYRFDVVYGFQEAPSIAVTDGIAGVEIFFAISGFVIAMLLARKPLAIDFLAARAIRLYPAYWAAVLITFAVVSLAALPGRTVSPADALINLSMVQGLFDVPYVDGAYWSLGVELSFYFYIFLLYTMRLTENPTRVVIGWLCAALAVQAAEPLIGAHLRPYVAKVLISDWIPFFGVGMLAQHVQARRRIGIPVVASICLAILTAGIVRDASSALVAALICLAFALLLSGRLGWLCCRPLLLLGSVSYPLYLLHQNIGYACIRALLEAGLSSNGAVAVAIGFALILAWAVAYGVERPLVRCMRWSYKYLRHRSQSARVLQ